MIACLLTVISTVATGAVKRMPATASEGSMPYADAGLSEREAAAHLLDRFTFGPKPGQVDEVVDLGLERWFESQVEADEKSHDLDDKLAQLSTLELTNEQILETYPRPGRVRRQAIEEGRLDPNLDPQDERRALKVYYEEMGYRPQRQLMGELIAQKVFRAVDSHNQLEEVLVDFWFNHFYVSVTDNQCRPFVGTYERDAIRPHALRNFGDMLEASAKHPAMLLYLDNAQSSAPEDAVTTASLSRDALRQRPGREGEQYQRAFEKAERQKQKRMDEMAANGNTRRRGVNENYARELLELHTLGVDGGYDQADVEELARALTGWTVVPGEQAQRMRERMAKNKKFAAELGFVVDGDFFFNAEWHDAGEKVILGRRFEQGGGLEEGERILDMLVDHPSTANHIAYKFAVRFVSDTPPDAFVAGLASVFGATGGDVEAMLWYTVRSPHFWAPEARRAKIKSPLELVASGVRAVDGEVKTPRALVEWVDKMGQPLYRYQAPTGFPDRAEAWVNAGALLHRMNYGMSLAMGEVRGVRVKLDGLLDGKEPESAEAALYTYAALLLPERDLQPTIEVLTPMLTDPELAEQIDERSRAVPPPADSGAMMDDDITLEPFEEPEAPRKRNKKRREAGTVEQVVGLIIGSPEFQRR